MPRPAKAEDEKRQLIGARFNPEDRRSIEGRAKEAGRTPNAEVERLATMFLDCDEKTLALLRDIAGEIAWIESAVMQTREVRWHQNEELIAAVEEMLRHGPMQRYRRPLNESAPQAAKYLDEEIEATKRKHELVKQLASLGVTVKPERFVASLFAFKSVPAPAQPRGIFGRLLGDALEGSPVETKAGESLFSKYLDPNGFDHRITERAAIAAIPNENVRERAMGLFDEIVELDGIEESASKARKEAYADTLEAQDDGRELYRSMRRQRAREAMQAGEPYSGWDLV